MQDKRSYLMCCIFILYLKLDELILNEMAKLAMTLLKDFSLVAYDQ